jgi:hypothetical protein
MRAQDLAKAGGAASYVRAAQKKYVNVEAPL